MPEPTETLLGEAFFILRVIRSCSQEQLAAAADVRVRRLQIYERGTKTPPPAVQGRLLKALGFSSRDLAVALDFAQRTRRSIRTPVSPAADDFDNDRIARIAAEVAQWFEDLLHGGLEQVLPATAADADEPAIVSPSALGTPPAPATPAASSQRRAAPSAEEPAAPSQPAPAAPAAGAPPPPWAEPPVHQPPPATAAAAHQHSNPPWADALQILRTLRRINQNELAAAAAVKPSSVSAYERGAWAPPPPVLHRLVTSMGYPANAFEGTLSFLQRARASAGVETAPPSLAAQLEELVRKEARAMQDFATERLQRLLATMRGLRSRRDAPDLWRRLEPHSDAERRWLITGAAEFQTSGLCELLCEESRTAAGDSAERAIALAELAVLAAAQILRDPLWRSRLTGYARAHLANALRVRGELRRSELEHRAADAAWQAGAASDPGFLNEARVLHLQASLCNVQGRLRPALALLDRALAIDRWGETASLLISKVIALEGLGDFEEAIALLREAASKVDPEREPRQLFLIRAHLLGNLCFLGRHAEAQLGISEVRALAHQLGNDLDRLRVLWMEAQIAAGLGQFEDALSKLGQVRAEFMTRAIPYDAALATLELAKVYATLGRMAEVRSLSRESVPIFQAQGLHRQARIALDLFRKAAENETPIGDLTDRLIHYMARARFNPCLRFHAAA
jgi:transcriptional regulator with XRE-family HTH domain/tetratricopeptide (TPR) repeat protein